MFQTIAWVCLATFLLGAQVGVPLLAGRYRPGLALLAVASVGGFAFAFITGFSIGRFVVLLPLVLTAFAVTYGRPRRVQLAAHAAAIAIYIALAWLLAEQVGLWGIQIDLPLCLLAYLVAGFLPKSSAVGTGNP